MGPATTLAPPKHVSKAAKMYAHESQRRLKSGLVLYKELCVIHSDVYRVKSSAVATVPFFSRHRFENAGDTVERKRQVVLLFMLPHYFLLPFQTLAQTPRAWIDVWNGRVVKHLTTFLSVFKIRCDNLLSVRCVNCLITGTCAMSNSGRPHRTYGFVDSFLCLCGGRGLNMDLEV